MKVTQFGPGGLPLPLAGWSTGAQSIGSNADTFPALSAQNFVQRITANSSNVLQNPIVNFASGSNILLTLDQGPFPSQAYPSNTIRIHSTATGGGTVSAGSNSTRVSEDSSAGASTTLWSPYDHRHDGIGTITASSSNTMQRGTFNLRSGSNVSFGLTDSDGDGELDTMTINSTASGGGGSSSTIAYTSLKPGSPTDDFTSALSGWTAVSTAGSFVIGNCHAKAIDGSHLFMGYVDQAGYIYQSASNVDQEWIVGGLTATSRTSDNFVGIALLSTAGDGVGLIYHVGDNTGAIIGIAAGVYAPGSPTAQIFTTPRPGNFIGTPSKIWFRLTRVTNTWDAYYSFDGVNWTYHVAATISKTVTVARKCIGIFNNAGQQQIWADWVNTV